MRARRSIGKDYITPERLLDFLNTVQRDPRLNEILYPKLSRAGLEGFLSQYEPDQKFRGRDLIGLEGFTQYLMSDENAVMYVEHLSVHQDMDQPISHYFVNSSHNTYLVGRQYGGKSSVEMYRNVLIAGCRSVFFISCRFEGTISLCR